MGDANLRAADAVWCQVLRAGLHAFRLLEELYRRRGWHWHLPEHPGYRYLHLRKGGPCRCRRAELRHLRWREHCRRLRSYWRCTAEVAEIEQHLLRSSDEMHLFSARGTLPRRVVYPVRMTSL